MIKINIRECGTKSWFPENFLAARLLNLYHRTNVDTMVAAALASRFTSGIYVAVIVARRRCSIFLGACFACWRHCRFTSRDVDVDVETRLSRISRWFSTASLVWRRKCTVRRHVYFNVRLRSLSEHRKMATAVPSRFAVLSIEDDDYKPKKTQKNATSKTNAKNKGDKSKQQQQQQQPNKKKQNKVWLVRPSLHFCFWLAGGTSAGYDVAAGNRDISNSLEGGILHFSWF